MPRGIDTYKGLGLPNQGNVNLKALSTVDALTITGSSGGPANLLVLRTLPSSGADVANAADSTLATLDQLRVSSLGAVQLTSNSSVVMTFSTAGVSGGQESTAQEWSIDSSGRARGLRRNISTVAAASTRFSVDSSMVGTLFVLTTGIADTRFIEFPAPAGITPGDWWEFFINSSAVGSDRFISSGTTGPVFHAKRLTTAADVTTAGVQFGTSGFNYLRVTAMSSARLFCQTQIGFTSESSAGAQVGENFAGNLVAATTSS